MNLGIALPLSLLTLTAAGVFAIGAVGAMPPASRPVVRIEQGRVRGALENGIYSFKGIPYAAPPVGPLRWREPQPPAAWPDERDGREFGPQCLQPSGRGKAEGSEDCLTLNVWSVPGPRDAKNPVLVFIHGGFFVTGSSSQSALGNAMFDGRRLAARGQAVVVTINYRLGPLGFLAHPGLTAENGGRGSGNYGLLDQLAALRWVQSNIRAFGGDPARVMVFGQSAGAASVAALVASPLSRGLFSGALVQSGFPSSTPLAAAERNGSRVAAKLGCGEGPDALECMRAQGAARIVTAVPMSFGKDGVLYAPNLDGNAIPVPVLDAFKSGAAMRVPVIFGSNADETSTIFGPLFGDGPKNLDAYRAHVLAAYGPERGERVLARYPGKDFKSPKDALIRLSSDEIFNCPARRMARALSGAGTGSVYRYFFTHRPESLFFRGFGAGHGLELPFVFGVFSGLPGFGASRGEKALSPVAMGYWTRFAAKGDPNGDGAPAWEPYDAARDNYLEFAAGWRSGAGVRAADCDLWDSL